VIASTISLISAIIGMWLLGRKHQSAFIVFTVGLFFQVPVFYGSRNWPLLCQTGIFICFNAVNYNKWRLDR